MLTQTPVYIVAAGEDLSPAAALSMPCLHLAYTLGSQGQLRRDGPDSQSPGGLLGFYDKGLTPPLSLDAGRLIRQIREECRTEGIPVNVSDDRDLCDFYFPSVVMTDEAVIGSSSGGEDPGRTKELRRRIEKTLGESGWYE